MVINHVGYFWMEVGRDKARLQGWDLSKDGKTMEIVKVELAEPQVNFEDDVAALKWVFGSAIRDCPIAMLAIYLSGRFWDDAGVMLPATVSIALSPSERDHASS